MTLTNEQSSSIPLSDVFRFDNIDQVKFRFNLMFRGNWNPLEVFKSGQFDTLLEGQYWNYSSRKSYKVGDTTIGLVRMNRKDLWLLFHVGRVTKDLDKFEAMGYEYEPLPEYEKYVGRMIIRFKNKSQAMVRKASAVLPDCELAQILPGVFEDDLFPGYDKVNVAWSDLERLLSNESWRTALENQKGVYLITDSSNGKLYVGSAYGQQMLLGRWRVYSKNGHGGNVELKKLSLSHIRENFRYSILEIFKSTTDDAEILARESWWKAVLSTQDFGYNRN